MRNKQFERLGLAAAILCLILVAVQWAPAGASQWNRKPDIIIGWTAWADAEVVSKMAAIILSQGMKYDVELTLADISVQYRGLAQGNLDVMLMSWQPKTHKAYLRKYRDDLSDLGVLYRGANLGWVIPDYIPKDRLDAIPDLSKPEVLSRMGDKIHGIGADAGIMALSRKALDAYHLNYELVSESGPAMAQRIGKAVSKNAYIVGTGWRPHWKFVEYPLRFLKDPKGIFKGTESVHAISRKGFGKDHPKAAAFLSRMQFSLDELEAIMAQARKTSHRQAITDWIRDHHDKVSHWMTGKGEG